MESFSVFGEPVEVVVSSEATGGVSSAITQTSPPGGGPPLHSHQHEEETFYVVRGEYEFILNGERRQLTAGEGIFAPRGSVHTFKNVGATEGKLLVVTVPGGFENYLRAISPLSIPQDMQQILQISEQYGVAFVS